jgi:GTP-binding protein
MSLLYRARFATSAARLDQLPPPGPPEVAFVGRSNAGKSSAINVLTQQRRLAFSSKTPGRTRLINLFGLPDPLLTDAWLGFLVDLPGYGYAEAPKSEIKAWGQVLGSYLQTRQSLAGVVMMIDIRRGVTELDLALVDFMAAARRPVLALLTKADKLPYGQRIRAEAAVRKDLSELGTLQTIAFSATHRIGIEAADEAILRWISPSTT